MQHNLQKNDSLERLKFGASWALTSASEAKINLHMLYTDEELLQVLELQEKAFFSESRIHHRLGFLYTKYTLEELRTLLANGAKIYFLKENQKIYAFALTVGCERFKEYQKTPNWIADNISRLLRYRYLEQLVVSDQFRNKGIGSELLRLILEEEPRLLTDFSTKPHINYDAKKFFIFKGFKKFGNLENIEYRGRKLSFEARTFERPSLLERPQILKSLLLGAALLMLSSSIGENSPLPKLMGMNPGVWSGVLELSTWALAALYWLKRRNDLVPSRTDKSDLWLPIAFLCLAFADFIYMVKYYHFQISSPTGLTAFTTSALYTFSFIALTFGLLSFCDFSLLSIRKSRISAGNFLVSMTWAIMAGAWLSKPLLFSSNWHDFPIANRLIELASLYTSCILFFVSSFLYFESRSPYWSTFLAGTLTLLLGDWAIKYQKFYMVSVSYQFFESLWLLGSLIMSASILIARDHIPQISLDTKNLLPQKTFAFLTILVFALVSPFLLEFSDLQFRNWIAWIGLCPLALTLLILYVDEDMSSNKLVNLQERNQMLSEEDFRQRSENEKIQFIGKTSAQVAHDIKSPLATLEIISKTTLGMPEPSRILLLQAVKRIREVANDLLQKRREMAESIEGSSLSKVVAKKPQQNTQACLALIIKNLLDEKELQTRSKTSSTQQKIQFLCDFQSFYQANHFVSFDTQELTRTLSNIIQNAIDAFEDFEHPEPKIEISMKILGNDQLRLLVSDNGKGISPEFKPFLFREGKSFEKKQGNGLGLFHARQNVQKWNGNLEIDSDLGKGTRVIFTFKRSSSPLWFTNNIPVSRFKKIIIIDDDPSIANLWSQKIPSSINTQSFLTLEEFEKYLESKQNDNDAVLYLVDYQFRGHKENGLDYIIRHQINKQSILVTSNADQIEIQTECSMRGIGLIPKNFIDCISFV